MSPNNLFRSAFPLYAYLNETKGKLLVGLTIGSFMKGFSPIVNECREGAIVHISVHKSVGFPCSRRRSNTLAGAASFQSNLALVLKHTLIPYNSLDGHVDERVNHCVPQHGCFSGTSNKVRGRTSERQQEK